MPLYQTQNLLTNTSKISQIGLLYYAPVAIILPDTTTPIHSYYCFLSKPTPWPAETTQIPLGDVKSIKQIQKNIFVAKQIKTSDISPVIERIDWTSGTSYNYYRDDIDMMAKDLNGFLVQKFYVKNKYDQVFKCLWNNNGGPSTREPYFEPGTYSANRIFQGDDGYKWKFIYTVDTGLKVKFMDRAWMPVQIGANIPNPLITSAGAGCIDVINVVETGTGYDTSNAVVQVSITGDGTGALATANVTPLSAGGYVTDIIVNNPGSNYTFANVTITSTIGSNAELTWATSPVGGHGFDPVSELGCERIMLTAQFDGDENGFVPTNIDYHQVGIVVNPTTKQYSPKPANGSIYSTTTDIVVAPGADSGYLMDELVYQGTLDKPSFYATVLSFDPETDVIKLINTVGVPANNGPIFGQTSKVTRTLLSSSVPNYAVNSGYVIYVENRPSIQRSSDGIEQFRFVLGF
jgi:hypothetical protein